jgi:hypothetical protein
MQGKSTPRPDEFWSGLPMTPSWETTNQKVERALAAIGELREILRCHLGDLPEPRSLYDPVTGYLRPEHREEPNDG